MTPPLFLRHPIRPLRAILRWWRIHGRTGRLALLRRMVIRMPSERQRVFVLTIVSGVLCGLAAVGFHLAIRGAERLLIDRARDSDAPLLWMILSPTLGGLLCGILLHRFFPRAAGSGIPQVKEAYAAGGARISLRDAAAKFFIATVQIGSGASLGREGPTVHICAGIASKLGQFAALSRQGMRRMLPVGAAAGIAAAFNAPIAAVTFAIEEIVGDLDQAVLSGVIVAAALAAVIERSILGEHPVFHLTMSYHLEHASSLLLYALLGILAALVSVMFTDGLLMVRRLFRTSPFIPRWAGPAVGGLITGILAAIAFGAWRLEGVTGGGYSTLMAGLAGRLAVTELVILCIMKLAATVFSYGSGGAGGIFAPSLFIGGMLGGAIGHLDRMFLGESAEQLGAFVLVGMGAVFAGSIRAPITSVLIIFEMTNGYSLILPLMIANMSAYALARKIRPVPIYEALLNQDGVVLPHRSAVSPSLERIPVSAVMTTEYTAIPEHLSAAAALESTAARPYNIYPVIDDAGVFKGLVEARRLREAAARGDLSPVGTFAVAGAAVFPETPVIRAASRLLQSGAHLLAVVAPGEEPLLLGLLTSSDVVRASAGQADEGPASASEVE